MKHILTLFSLSLCFLFAHPGFAQNDGKIVLSSDSFKNGSNSVAFNNDWKYSPRDNLAWATSAFDDTGWEPIEVGTFPDDRMGWVRFVLEVDSTLWNVPLKLAVGYYGAVEIYLDGELLCQFGKVGASKTEEIPHIAQSAMFAPERWTREKDTREALELKKDDFDNTWSIQALSSIVWGSHPISFPTPLEAANGKSRHVVAIRYSSFVLESPSWSGVQPRLPIRIGYANQMSEHRAKVIRDVTFHQILIIKMAVVFGTVLVKK